MAGMQVVVNFEPDGALIEVAGPLDVGALRELTVLVGRTQQVAPDVTVDVVGTEPAFLVIELLEELATGGGDGFAPFTLRAKPYVPGSWSAMFPAHTAAERHEGSGGLRVMGPRTAPSYHPAALRPAEPDPALHPAEPDRAH